MKSTSVLSAIFALGLTLGAPAALAHVGHGDEFQAEGGVNRVQVNTETDSLLGVRVNPIEAAADGSGAVLIPVTALVDDNGRQLVFVQYENFYEPVDVTIGSTQGDLIAVTDGLSVGEQRVTQGSLTLYAESRKTQTAEDTPITPAEATPANLDDAHAQADAEGIPHSHDADGNLVEAQSSSGVSPVALLVGFGVVAAAGTGTMAVLSSRKKKSRFSEGTYTDRHGDS